MSFVIRDSYPILANYGRNGAPCQGPSSVGRLDAKQLHVWIVMMVDMMLLGSKEKTGHKSHYNILNYAKLIYCFPRFNLRPAVHPTVKVLDQYVGATMIMELLSTWPPSLLPYKATSNLHHLQFRYDSFL